MQIDREVATPTGINAVPLPRPAASVEKRSAPVASEPAAATAESSPKIPKVGSISCALQQIQDWVTLLDLWHAKPSRVAGERTQRTESNTQPIDEQRAELYAMCLGSLIYLSIDRKDIRFETKELARHMRGPREVDWSNLLVLAQYLLHKPDLARVTCLNAESKASGFVVPSDEPRVLLLRRLRAGQTLGRIGSHACGHVFHDVFVVHVQHSSILKLQRLYTRLHEYAS